MMIINNVQDVQDMARGAVLLGTGGGGDPYVGELFVRAQIREGNYPKVVDTSEIADDAFVVSIAGIGAPSVIVEHLVSEKTLLRVLARAEAHFGRRVDALISAEIGGANSMFPLALSAVTGLPVVDADGIGRAVPHIEMTTLSIFGCPSTPAILMDDSGNTITIEAINDRISEDLCRAVTGALGALTYGALYPMTGKQAKEIAVQRTLTQTLEIGRAIREAREQSRDIFAALIECLESRDGRKAKVLFDGKIVDVTHETRDGWHWGRCTMKPLSGGSDICTVDIQNEFPIARLNDKPLCMVPDLISILDSETGEPLTGEMLAYGQRVTVLGYAADDLLRRPESLEVLGPRCFGLDMDYTPLEQLG